jgi:hypothetical protein
MVGVLLIFAGAKQLPADRVIVNGTFEQGNTGFTSAYSYSPGSGLLTDIYTVAPDPHAWNVNWLSYGDHTTGSGQMMLLNAGVNPNLLAWSETVAVAPNTLYDFSAWVSSCDAIATANLDFVFNGGSPTRFDAPLVAGVWENFTMAWNSGSATSLSIQVYDRNTTLVGNDFALDDISLTAAPEPRCLALLAVAAAGLFAYAWRWRTIGRKK